MAAHLDDVLIAFREAKRELYADYEAGRPGRFRKIRTGLYGTGAAHWQNEQRYFEAIEYIRDLERNDPEMRKTLKISVNQKVGPGFGYEPDTGDRSLNQDLKDDFWDWALDPLKSDAAGQFAFPKREQMVAHHTSRDGRCFVVPNDDGALEYLESESCKTPRNSRRNIVLGVEIDERRREKAFFFTKRPLGILDRLERLSDATRVPAMDEDGNPQVFHMKNLQRFTDVGGISDFIAATNMMGMLDDIQFANLVKAQHSSYVIGSWETDIQAPSEPPQSGPRESKPGADGVTPVLQDKIVPGTIQNPPPGKKLKIHSTNIPSTEAMEHMRRVQQMIGLQVDTPLIVSLMDASETNFSGWRGAKDVANRLYRAWQIDQANQFHRNVYNWRIRYRMAEKGALPQRLRNAYKTLGGRLFRHKCKFPAWPSINPVQDATSNAIRRLTAQASPQQIAGEGDRDWDEIYRETVDNMFDAYVYGYQRRRELIKLIPEAEKDITIFHMTGWDFPKGMQLIDTAEIANDQEQPIKKKPKSLPAPQPAKQD